MAALVDCPHCGGRELNCVVCGGYGAVSDDFAEKISRGEGHSTGCEDCGGGHALCVLMPGRLYEIRLCAACYAARYHPRLYDQMDQERADRCRAANRAGW